MLISAGVFCLSPHQRAAMGGKETEDSDKCPPSAGLGQRGALGLIGVMELGFGVTLWGGAINR